MSNFKAGGASINKGKFYYSGIDPTGIFSDLTLVSIKFMDDKDRLDIECYQESTGYTITEYFSGPKPTDTEQRISINADKLVHFLSAFVPASVNEEGKDNRWGDEEISVDTFKEFCEFHTSKITIDPNLKFSLKKLFSPKKDPVQGYIKPTGTFDPVLDRKTYPFKDYGKYPFISSVNYPNKINIHKDVSDEKYPMFLECNFTELIKPPTNNFVPPANATTPAIPASLVESDDLPF